MDGILVLYLGLCVCKHMTQRGWEALTGYEPEVEYIDTGDDVAGDYPCARLDVDTTRIVAATTRPSTALTLPATNRGTILTNVPTNLVSQTTPTVTPSTSPTVPSTPSESTPTVPSTRESTPTVPSTSESTYTTPTTVSTSSVTSTRVSTSTVTSTASPTTVTPIANTAMTSTNSRSSTYCPIFPYFPFYHPLNLPRFPQPYNPIGNRCWYNFPLPGQVPEGRFIPELPPWVPRVPHHGYRYKWGTGTKRRHNHPVMKATSTRQTRNAFMMETTFGNMRHH